MCIAVLSACRAAHLGIANLINWHLVKKRHYEMSDITFSKKGLESYITDQEVESQLGVWLPPFPGDRRFKILRAGGSNTAFARAFQTAIKPHRRAMDKGTLDPKVSEALMVEVYSKHILVDWAGINDENEVPVPFSTANAIAFFTAFPEVFSDIVSYATEVATFAQENLEEAKDVLGEI